jgi:hypothetical protein
VALLDGTNDQTVARYRNEVMDQIESVEGLDDQIEPTGPAIAKTPQVCRKLKASQIAAFLASHADEVIDPTERMVEAVDEVRLAAADDVVNVERKISTDVARMVAGVDQQKSKAVADKVMDWLKTAVAANKDELTDAKRAALEQSAAKVVGDVSNIEILDHYLQSEIAVLLSNPQIVPAIDSLGNARVREQQK